MKQKINQSPRDIMQILISFIMILSVCVSVSGVSFYFAFPDVMSAAFGLIFILNLIMLIITFITMYKLNYKEKYSYKNMKEEK
jgi:uncharacterized membrane protein